MSSGDGKASLTPARDRGPYRGEERRRSPPPEETGGGGALSVSARLYLGFVYAVALISAGGALLATEFSSVDNADLLPFAVLAVLATVSQLFMVEAPSRHSYHVTPAFLLAAVLLVHPALLVPLVIVTLIPEWLRYRYPWYIQTFNISTYLVNVLAARAAYGWIAPSGLELSWLPAMAAGAAALAFAVLNHVMVALVIWLARRISPRDSGVISLESLEMDMALATVGIGIAIFWQIEPLLIVLQVVPMYLFHRALAVPQLQDEANHDAKTGLLATRRFMELFGEELARSTKSGRPLSVVMADLDFFRDINNTLGHLSGDHVLKAVADVLRQTLRRDDVLARFGGEEFVMMLRYTAAEGAMIAAERVRSAVERAEISLPGRQELVRVTLSLGVASFPEPCPNGDSLLHLADLALYQSKQNGRNRATAAAPSLEDGPFPGPSLPALSAAGR